MAEPTIAVVVPSFRRPEQLETCLQALAAQTRPPDQIVVAVRSSDLPTADVARAARGVTIALVEEPGVLAALQAGLSKVNTAIVAFTDDDAAPRPDWLERLSIPFANPVVGAVGGRDLIPGQLTPTTPDVGRLSRFGKLVGNHHLGEGPAREVTVLKCVNMAFRTEAISLPRGLRGQGAQVHFEVATCLNAKRHGWTLVYDPAILVDHYPGPRFDSDRRDEPDAVAAEDAAYNLVAGIVGTSPEMRLRRAGYGLLVGDRATPGLLRGSLGALRGELSLRAQVIPSLKGQASALLRPADRLIDINALGHAPRRRRVTFVAHDVHRHGGMERAIAEVIDVASEHNDVDVVSSTLELHYPERVHWRRIKSPVRPFPARLIVFWLKAGRAVRASQPDLVHTVGAVVGTRADVVSVHFCHAGYQSTAGRKASSRWSLRSLNHWLSERLSLAAESFVYTPARARMFTAVSPGLADELQKFYPSVPTAVVPNGIDHTQFRPDPAVRRAMRDEHAVGDDEVIVLFVGGDWGRKGLPQTIEALSVLPPDLTRRTRLWIVGSGDVAEFEAHARRLGVADRVTFFGKRADPAPYHQAADIFVLASEYETFSMSCYEAAATGLPIVGTRVSGLVDLIGDGTCGIPVDRSPRAIAGGLEQLILDPELRHELGRAAIARAAPLTWDSSVAATLALYDTSRDAVAH